MFISSDIGNFVSLKFIWGFLKAVLTDQLKERLKPKDSASKAKDKSFKLYESLGEVKQGIDDFVNALQSYIQIRTTSKPPEQKRILQNTSNILYNSTNKLTNYLEKLEAALKPLSMQLEIHAYPLSVKLELMRLNESDIVGEHLFPFGSKEDLEAILDQAIENQKLINILIKDYRTFLAKEFSYKDSF